MIPERILRGIHLWVTQSDSLQRKLDYTDQVIEMNSQIFWLLLLLSSFFVCSAATAHYSYAQTNQLSQEQLIAAAKREGKLVWYATLTSADARTFLNLFEQKYPFIKTTHFGGNSERMLNRILTEASTGQHLFDLVNVAPINILKTRGFLTSYRSVEAHAYPSEFRDPQDFWVSFYDLRYVLAYNTALIKATEAPND
jgi:iron(III) transport system substrate-binding protein